MQDEVRIFGVRKGEPQPFPLSLTTVAKALEDPEIMVWVHLHGSGKGATDVLEHVFALHPLLIEDALRWHPAPKLEEHRGYLYVALHHLTDLGETERVSSEDIDIFCGDGFVITHQFHACEAVEHLWADRDRAASLLAQSPAHVLHAISDRLVDNYLAWIETAEQKLATLDEQMVEDAPTRAFKESYVLQHNLLYVRRIAFKHVDIFRRLSENRTPRIPETLRQFFRDVFDHSLRAHDLTEKYREILTLQLSARNDMRTERFNRNMNVLTMISTVMLPLSFLTGFFGMNFAQMPLIARPNGFFIGLCLMLASAFTTFLWMRRRGF